MIVAVGRGVEVVPVGVAGSQWRPSSQGHGQVREVIDDDSVVAPVAGLDDHRQCLDRLEITLLNAVDSALRAIPMSGSTRAASTVIASEVVPIAAAT